MRRRTEGTGPGDRTTRMLKERGVYHLRTESEPKVIVAPTYSLSSGIRYTFVLSLALWWFPLVGNMIAGYVGGRRSGSPWRGVIAAVVPLAVIFVFDQMLALGLLPGVVVALLNIPGEIQTALLRDLPALAPYYQATMLYLSAFIVFLRSLLQYNLNLYLVTVVFAYLGGAVSDLKQREFALYMEGSSANVTLNMTPGPGGDAPIPASRVEDGHTSTGGSGGAVRPRKTRGVVPVAIHPYPNWRRRRVRGEKALLRAKKGREDVLEKLEKEGVRLKREDVPPARRKRAATGRERGGDQAAGADTGGAEGDDLKESAPGRQSAIDRAIARYLKGERASGPSPSGTAGKRDWDVL